MTIVSYPIQYEQFIEKAGWLSLGHNNFLDNLFIDMTKLETIPGYVKHFRFPGDKNPINMYSIRDTIIYNLHKPNNPTHKIFVYMLSKILSKSTGSAVIYETPEYLKIIHYYYEILSKNYDSIITTYNTLQGAKSGTIDNYYNSIVAQYNKIYSFVRIGTRTVEPNPRYKYTEFASNQPDYLKLDYINTDKENKDVKSSPDNLEKYIFGMYDSIYVPDLENNAISEDFFNKCLWDDTKGALKNNICVIGIGQSGSGKTSSLISFKNTSVKPLRIEDGILIEALRNKKFKATYKKLILTITEITLDPKKTPGSINDVTDTFYTTKDACVPTTYVSNASSWKLETKVDSYSPEEKTAAQDIGTYIVWIMENRRLIHPTPNNPVSSRSHMVICLTCTPADPKGEAKNIIFLDLAGNENEFECDKPSVIIKFYEKYMLEEDKTKLKKVFEDVGETCSKDRIDTINSNASTMRQYIDELNGDLDKLVKLETQIQSIEGIKKYLETKIVTKLDKSGTESLMEYLSSTPMPYLSRYLFGNKDEDEVKQQYADAERDIKLLDELCKEYIPKNTTITIITNNGKKKTPLDTKTLGKFINGRWKDGDNQLGINKDTNYLRTLKTLRAKYTDLDLDIFFVLIKQIEVKLNDLLTTKSSYKFYNFDTIKDPILQNISARKEEITCDKPKLEAIAGECNKRRLEGYMINRSIRDMIKEIKSLMRVKLIREDKDKKISYMPLCFETQIYENCLDPLKDQEIYDTFYDTPETNTETNSSIILQTIKEKDVDLLNLDFVVFTVINISNDTNNPPAPPFININDLIKHTHIIKDDEKLANAYKKVLEKLKKYRFYYPESGQTYIDQITYIMKLPTTLKQAKALIEFINNVNQTTLIGTLESSDKLKHYIFNSIPCLITENTDPPIATGGKRQFIEDRNHMIDQNRRHISTRRKQLKGSKLTRKSKKDYRYS